MVKLLISLGIYKSGRSLLTDKKVKKKKVVKIELTSYN